MAQLCPLSQGPWLTFTEPLLMDQALTQDLACVNSFNSYTIVGTVITPSVKMKKGWHREVKYLHKAVQPANGEAGA